jgi:hypothetical protein
MQPVEDGHIGARPGDYSLDAGRPRGPNALLNPAPVESLEDRFGVGFEGQQVARSDHMVLGALNPGKAGTDLERGAAMIFPPFTESRGELWFRSWHHQGRAMIGERQRHQPFAAEGAVALDDRKASYHSPLVILHHQHDGGISIGGAHRLGPFGQVECGCLGM